MTKLLGGLLLAASLTACSFSASVGGDVEGEKLESVVADRLAEQVGQRPDSVDCPDSLKAEKGATTRCTLTADGMKLGVTVTAGAVKDGNVDLDIQVDDKPQ